MTEAPNSLAQLLPCPLCRKPPGQKVGPPALARCVNKDCEGSKLGANTLAEWNAYAAPADQVLQNAADEAFERYRVGKFSAYAPYPIDAFTYFTAGFKAARGDVSAQVERQDIPADDMSVEDILNKYLYLGEPGQHEAIKAAAKFLQVRRDGDVT